MSKFVIMNSKAYNKWYIICCIQYAAYSKDKLKPNVTNILYEHVISSKIVTFENGYTNKAVTVTNVNK